VRSTDTGVRPTVGVLRAPLSVAARAPGADATGERPPRAAVVVGRVPREEVVAGPTRGALRFTEETPLCLDVAAAATAVRDGALAAVVPERGFAVLPVAVYPLGLSLYLAFPA